MRFQLVLQFRADGTADYDQLIALEDRLISELASSALVDGHDYGLGVFNIFILTNEPLKSFEAAARISELNLFKWDLRAAYRAIDAEDFVVLWPPNQSSFAVN